MRSAYLWLRQCVSKSLGRCPQATSTLGLKARERGWWSKPLLKQNPQQVTRHFVVILQMPGYLLKTLLGVWLVTFMSMLSVRIQTAKYWVSLTDTMQVLHQLGSCKKDLNLSLLIPNPALSQ